MEPGETLREAVAREVAEETGLTVDVGDLVGHLEVISDERHYVILDFHAAVMGGKIMAGSDVTEVAWMGRRRLEEAGPTDGLLSFLADHGIALAP
jgi:8-oxo-dGTP diphosphatase